MTCPLTTHPPPVSLENKSSRKVADQLYSYIIFLWSKPVMNTNLEHVQQTIPWVNVIKTNLQKYEIVDIHVHV